MYVCMHHNVRPALGKYTPCACANVISQQFFTRKATLGKKGSLALEWIQAGSDPLTDHCLHHRASGALAALDLDLKLGSYIFHYSE